MKKHNTCQFIPAYPNEAAPSYFSEKMVDAVTSAITSMGVIAIIFFLFTL